MLNWQVQLVVNELQTETPILKFLLKVFGVAVVGGRVYFFFITM